MLPETTGIDAIIKEEDKIIVIQIATGQKQYINTKFNNFKAYLDKNFQFKLTDEKIENYNGLITNGTLLQNILDGYEKQ